MHGTGFVTMRDFISSDLMQWDKFAKPTLGPAWERPGPGRAFTNALDATRFQTLRQRVQDMHARQGAVQTLATSMARSKLQGKVRVCFRCVQAQRITWPVHWAHRTELALAIRVSKRSLNSHERGVRLPRLARTQCALL